MFIAFDVVSREYVGSWKKNVFWYWGYIIKILMNYWFDWLKILKYIIFAKDAIEIQVTLC